MGCSQFHHEDDCLDISGCAWCDTTGKCVSWNICKDKPLNKDIPIQCPGDSTKHNGWSLSIEDRENCPGSIDNIGFIITMSIFSVCAPIFVAGMCYFFICHARRQQVYTEIN